MSESQLLVGTRGGVLETYTEETCTSREEIGGNVGKHLRKGEIVPYTPGTFAYASKEAMEMWAQIFVRVQPSFTKRATEYRMRRRRRRQQRLNHQCTEDHTRYDDDTHEHEDAVQLAKRFDEDFRAFLALKVKEEEREDKQRQSGVDVVALCTAREECLRKYGHSDIFDTVKRDENQQACQCLDAMLRVLDTAASPDDIRSTWRKLIRGVFAGNLFDLGSDVTQKRFEEQKQGGEDKSGDAVIADFIKVRDELHPPSEGVGEVASVLDNLEECVNRFATHTYAKAIVYVDNSGSDFVLGMLPLVRGLLRAGTVVILACNELPSINDITYDEAKALLENDVHDAVIRKAYAEGTLRVVSSGNGLPVIDLRTVSIELRAEEADADLVILEGMGRSIETNLTAVFRCDSLKLAVIKHEEVARCLGCTLYDYVCCFTRGEGRL